MVDVARASLYSIALLLLSLSLVRCGPDRAALTRISGHEAAPTVSPTEAGDDGEAEGLDDVQQGAGVKAPVDNEEAVDTEPVTLETYTTDLATLDPQVGEDVVALNNIESLFVHLTNYAPGSNNIVPEAASDWTVSDDGLVYTFNIRPDIPWVRYNPVTGETAQDIDDEGAPRFVTAHDFEFGIKRACDPDASSYFSTVIAPVIAGCENLLNFDDRGDDEAFVAARNAVGVTAVDAVTLEITLAFPASYFLSMTPMWIMAASPQWALEQYGNDRWLEPGQIVTNGRFVLHEWVPGVRRVLMRNPLIPPDMAGRGNIDKIVTTVVPDAATGYFMWLNNEVEVSAIPDQELATHLENHPGETAQISDLVVFYFGIRESKAPFDDPRVRRAFSAAFDRESFISNVRQGQGLPMTHFAPPGIFGAPPIDEVGVGYDLEFAREQLAAAGYPDCEGFPPVTLLGYSGRDTLDWIEFAQGQWEKNLGCNAGLIQIEQQSFPELLAATEASVPDEEAPHMWTLGWGPDYPDENNWVGTVLWCQNPGNRQKRSCGEVDDLIVAAREEGDAVRRIEMYRQIEEMFFGREGEYPIIPVWVRTAFLAQHEWLTDAPPALFGGQQYYHWTIDQEAKLEARSDKP